MYFRDYDGLAEHFDKSHFRCYEQECLATLFIVFETEAELEYHTDKVHRKNSKYKGGRTQYNANNLLGVKLDEDNDHGEDEEEPEEVVDIPGVGQMSADALRMFIHETENRGEDVPDYFYEILSQAKPKAKPLPELKNGKAILKDSVGIDFSRIVELFTNQVPTS